MVAATVLLLLQVTSQDDFDGSCGDAVWLVVRHVPTFFPVILLPSSAPPFKGAPLQARWKGATTAWLILTA